MIDLLMLILTLSLSPDRAVLTLSHIPPSTTVCVESEGEWEEWGGDRVGFVKIEKWRLSCWPTYAPQEVYKLMRGAYRFRVKVGSEQQGWVNIRPRLEERK